MLTFFLAYLLAGIVIGLISGMLGIGGGVIGIPILLLLFTLQGLPDSLSMHMAIGTFFAIILLTNITTTYLHFQKGMILFPIFKKMIIGIIVGSIVGVIIENYLNSTQLKHLFGICLMIIALLMFLQIKEKTECNLPNRKSLFFISSCFGMLSGMMGLGGGVFIVPYLNRYGIPIRNAIAISAACILPVATIGVIGSLCTEVTLHSGQFHSGFIYWPAFLGISITSLMFAPLGIKIAHTISTRLLKNIFAMFLMVIGVKMIFPPL